MVRRAVLYLLSATFLQKIFITRYSVPGILGSNTVNFLYRGKFILLVNRGSSKSGSDCNMISLDKVRTSSVRITERISEVVEEV